jgi:mono/diheme cytochrome c family protein
MKSKIFLAAIVLVLSLVGFKFLGPVQAEPASDLQIQRGKYLVESVGMCTDCHTPRNWLGNYDKDRWLQGAKLQIKPVFPVTFATFAPPIAGLPTFPNDESAIKFLTTGTNLANRLAMQPMPQFRFSAEDAKAVIAYLRSLKK